MESAEASEEHPIYSKVQQADSSLFMIDVNEGWRSSIMCGDLYEWAADWLVNDVLKARPPYAPGRRP